MAKVAFIGLGVMGFPMAGHLASEGHQVRVYNRNSAKAESWCATFAGEAAGTPREAAEGAEFVMTCVGNDDDLHGCVYRRPKRLRACCRVLSCLAKQKRTTRWSKPSA